LPETKSLPSLSKTSLYQFYHYCFEQKLPFAFYRLPEDKVINVIAQRSSELHNSSNSARTKTEGFVFAPFQEDMSFKSIFIQPDILCDEHSLPIPNFAIQNGYLIKGNKWKLKQETKKDFTKQIKEIRGQIDKDSVEKIVAARIIKSKKPGDFNPVEYFRSLCKRYPDAFVSLVFTDSYGLWIGASPEILLSVKSKEFKTFALAGTKDQIEKVNSWSHKEEQEQKIVSDYILSTFSSFTKEKPKVEGPVTITAGNVLHLRTTFRYQTVPYHKWTKVVQRLHPTPAVAGFPKQKAIDFILKHEKNPRAFYSGYLGPVNLHGGEVNLFVNLRCMQVLKNNLIVYVGCGITAQSKPEEEWEESKIKAETLLSLLKEKKVSKSFSPLPTDEHKQKGRSANSRNLPKKRHS
jgi:isochorismate synthase